MGHVNNTIYVKWVQDIAILHWETIVPDDLRGVYLSIVLRHEIDYRDQLLAGEQVEIRTWIGRASGPRFARYVDIRKPGAKRYSASAKTDWCMIDVQSRRPKRVGADLIEAFGATGLL